MPGSPRCPGETAGPGPNAPLGAVADDEFLLREVFNPYHVTNGVLIERAISLDDLLGDGFSVHRMRYVSAEWLKASIERRLSRPRSDEPWKSEGVAKLKAGEVREIRLDDDRGAFAVESTPTEDNPGHASIYAADPGKGKRHARKLRKLLLPLLENRMTVDEAYDGAAAPESG